jgi:hypothetical protein
MRLIDLTRTLDPTDVERMPEVVRPLAAVATGCVRSSAAPPTTFPNAKGGGKRW